MNQPAKAQEPSMEEILASIRRIIADEDSGKAVKPPAPPPKLPQPAPAASVRPPAPPPPRPTPPPAAVNNQSDIDAMLAQFDTAPKAAPAPPPPMPPPPAAPLPDVLDLTEAMAAPPPPAPSFRTIDASSDVVFADPSTEPPARVADDMRRSPPPDTGFDRGLISNATLSAVDSAFNSLAHTVLGNNARTLEDLVKEMLRPMLKGWLDDNLPSLVERIVRAEIERVSRGRS